jgi:hypothetical protein
MFKEPSANKKPPQELLIDVSKEEAPKPFDIILERIEQLKKNQYLRMLHRKKPLPLIQMLEENGFVCKLISGQQTKWEIIIWNKDDSFTHSYCSNHFIKA